MATHSLLTKLYRTAYLLGVAMLIASLALLWPAAGNVSPASAQTGWFISVDCTGFELDAPVHPAIDIRAQFRAPGDTGWSGRQSWSLPAGGPDTYSFSFNPEPVSGSEVLIRAFEAGTNNALFAEKVDVFCGDGPTNTPVPPTATPTNTTPPEEPTPTNTTPPEEPTPTNTTPPGEPTPTNTTPPEEPTPTNTTRRVSPARPDRHRLAPTPTNTTPPGEPSATPTDTGSIPTPTNTTPPGEPSATPTDTGSIPTPTNTTPPDQPNPTNTPGSSIPSPQPQGTPSVLIPVTGLDTSFNLGFLQRTLMNLGFGFLGLGLVLHGLSLGGRKDE